MQKIRLATPVGGLQMNTDVGDWNIFNFYRLKTVNNNRTYLDVLNNFINLHL